MNRAEDLIYPRDLLGMPREVLDVIVRRLNLDENVEGTVPGLATQIWRYVNETNDVSPLTSMLDRVFAGRIGLAWYRPRNIQIITGAERRLREGRTNFYDTRINWNAGDLNSGHAMVVGAAQTEMAGQEVTIVRLVAKLRDERVTDGLSFERKPVIILASLVLNPAHGCIEIRANSEAVPKLIERISVLLGIPETEMRPELIAPFAERAEEVADQLGGRLVSTRSRPDTIIQQMQPSQVEAVVEILGAVDQAISDPDSIDLPSVIVSARERLSLGGAYADLPLSTLVLANFQSIGMTAEENRDAREGPLYQFARPGIHHHGGYIRFPVLLGNRTDQHTIRLGATTNSVAFITKADEYAIARVRQVLFELEERHAEEAN